MRVLILSLIMALIVASGVSAQTACIDKAKLITMAKERKWVPAFRGEAKGKGEMLVLVNDTGSWQLFATNSQGLLCLIIMGDSSQYAIRK